MVRQDKRGDRGRSINLSANAAMICADRHMRTLPFSRQPLQQAHYTGMIHSVVEPPKRFSIGEPAGSPNLEERTYAGIGNLSRH